jgi:hypothetical protein
MYHFAPQISSVSMKMKVWIVGSGGLSGRDNANRCRAEADVREFSRQVELALFLDGKLDVSAA